MRKLFTNSILGIAGAALVALAVGTQTGLMPVEIGDQAASCTGIGAVVTTGCSGPTPTPQPAASVGTVVLRSTNGAESITLTQSQADLGSLRRTAYWSWNDYAAAAETDISVFAVAAYSDPGFKGACTSVDTSPSTTLPVIAGSPTTSSLIVLPKAYATSGHLCSAGGLMLYDGPNYQGNAEWVAIAPVRALPSSFFKKASSVRRVGSFKSPVLFSGYNGTGTCTPITGDVPDLSQVAVGDNAVMSVGWEGCPAVATPPQVNYPTSDQVASDPAAIYFGGTTHVFARHADNTLWHRGSLSASATGETMGGSITHGPAVASWGPGRLDAFARGADGALYQMWYDGTWHEWARLTASNTIHSDPVAVSWGANRIDVFARSATGGIVQVYWDGTMWREHHGLEEGRTIPYGLGVSSRGAGKLDLFYRGTDNALYHRAYDNGWKPWARISEPGWVYSDPDAVSYDGNHVDVFFQGPERRLIQLWWDAWTGWHGPVYHGGYLASGPSVSTRGPGLLDVFVRDTDGRLMRKSQEAGNQWQQWTEAIR